MKYSLIFKIACVSVLTAGATTRAEQLTLDQLPVAVRNSVNSQLANGAVKKIERLNRNGQNVYEVGFAQGRGLEKDFYFDENGRLVRGNFANNSIRTNAVPGGRAVEMTLKEVPDPVQKTINTETSNGPITKIEQIPYNGRTVYRVSFHQANGLDKLVYFNSDGSYVKDQPAERGMFARARAVVPITNLTELPTNVRNTINSETGANGPVKRIEEMPYNGRTVYKVAYQKPGGGEKLIYLNTDGSYVQDQLQTQTGVGTPAGASTASRASLSNATKVRLDQLPVAAQNRIRASAGAAAVEDIDKGTLNGKTVYEAAFKQNGNTVELRVDEQGHVIRDAEDQSILSGAKR